ncbi:MAG: tyrosine--tRNA ligase [Vampirovibrionales bacterium]
MTPLTPSPIQKEFLLQAEHLCRGAELIPANVEFLARRLQTAVETQTALRVKLGLDPTRPDLHLGHAVVLKKLRAFQDLGHQAVLIIGDATATIGDPSSKNQTRPPLTDEEVAINAETYLAQAGKIILTDKAEIVRNSTFFKPMGLSQLLQLMAQMTVAQMLVREDFAKRYANGTAISLHEFLYPLMQGYDSVMVKADIELGGTDQRFNNLVGRDLQLAYARLQGLPEPTPQQVLLLPLLEGTDGKVKMSKSYPEHCINFTDTPNDLFGKIMSIPDSLILRYETLLTPLPVEQLEQHREWLENPEKHQINPRDLKVNLAKFVVAMFHPAHCAEEAETAFVNQFKNKALPEDIPTHTLSLGEHSLVQVLVETGLATSKSEARRLIQGGGVKLNGDEKLTDVEALLCVTIETPLVLQAGKRKFVRLMAEAHV